MMDTSSWLLILGLWELVWRGIGVYNAAKKKKVIWAVVMAILNTIGILPIVYLIFFANRKAPKKVAAKPVAKKKAPKRRKKKK